MCVCAREEEGKYRSLIEREELGKYDDHWL